MRLSAVRRGLSAVLCAFSLSACMFVTDIWSIRTLRFEALSVVDASTLADEKSSFSGHGPNMDWFELEFTSPGANLYETSKAPCIMSEAKYRSAPMASTTRRKSWWEGGYVYGDNGKVYPYGQLDAAQAATRVYRAYFWMSGQECSGAVCAASYDLVKSAADLCFFLDGGAFPGSAFRSNLVRIPAAKVRDAVVQYRKHAFNGRQ